MFLFVKYPIYISVAVLPENRSGRALPVSHIPASWSNQKFGLDPGRYVYYVYYFECYYIVI